MKKQHLFLSPLLLALALPGLAVPGMPVGSPGMDGAVYGDRRDPYDVLLVAHDGSTRVFNSYNKKAST